MPLARKLQDSQNDVVWVTAREGWTPQDGWFCPGCEQV